MLDPLVLAWKIPSGESTNGPMLEAIAATCKPVMISMGMCTAEEFASAAAYFWFNNEYGPEVPVMPLQCTSLYPTPPDMIQLAGIKADGSVGLSDHSGTIWPSVAAVTLGASVVEVHIKLSGHDQGFDASSSITCEQLAQMVKGIRFIEEMKKYNSDSEQSRRFRLKEMRELFMGKHLRKAESLHEA